MIPYSRPKRSDLYTLTRINCLKTIPFTAAHTYIAHIWQSPPPPGPPVAIHQLSCQILVSNQLLLTIGLTVLFSYPNTKNNTLRAESPLIFLDKSGRLEKLGSWISLPDLTRKIEGDSAHRVREQ